MGSSRGSTAGTIDSSYYQSREHEANRIATGATLSATNNMSMRSFFHHTSNVQPDGGMLGLDDSHSTSSVRPGTLGYHGKALTSDDRLLGDPFEKRNLYFKTYTLQQKEKQKNKKSIEKRRQHENKQKIIAETERKAVSEFERYIVLAKLQS